jgi:DNA-binding CsgD family transcriptional regulator
MNDQKKTYLMSMDLQNLRRERKGRIDRIREQVKCQDLTIKAIRQVLSQGGKTIPELAESLSMATDTVLVYISTLKKYGIVGEGPKADGYYTYQLIK